MFLFMKWDDFVLWVLEHDGKKSDGCTSLPVTIILLYPSLMAFLKKDFSKKKLIHLSYTKILILTSGRKIIGWARKKNWTQSKKKKWVRFEIPAKKIIIKTRPYSFRDFQYTKTSATTSLSFISIVGCILLNRIRN